METKRFQRIYLEIGNICNLQCTFCPEVDRDKKRLDPAQFTKLLEQVKPFTDQVCFHVMGEPLAHPSFDQFVELAEENNVPVEITTNGTLLNEKIERALLNKTIRQINFSLQSFFDNFPASSPKTYLDKIFAFIHRAMTAREDLYINLRLWNMEENQTKDTLNQTILNRIEHEFGVAVNPNIDVRLKKSKKIINRLYLHYDSRFQWPNPKDPFLREKGTCHGTRSHVAIHADGTVVPCCLDKEAVINLGNVWEKPFANIIKSERFTKMKMGFESKQLVEDLCKKCQFSTRFPI